MGEGPHRAAVDLETTLSQFGHQAPQGEGPRRHPATQPVGLGPLILRGTCPPILPGAALPVFRRRCDHFTTLDGATLSAPATARTVSPASSRAIARVRMSIERALVMEAGLLNPASMVNQKSPAQGIPKDSLKHHPALTRIELGIPAGQRVIHHLMDLALLILRHDPAPHMVG